MSMSESSGAKAPARRFVWSPHAAKRLAEHLLAVSSLPKAVSLLGAELGALKRSEAAAVVMAAGGIEAFIVRELPGVTVEQIETARQHKAEAEKRERSQVARSLALRRKEQDRKVRHKVATLDAPTPMRGDAFETFLASLSKKAPVRLPYSMCIWGKMLSKTRESMVETVVVRITVPFGIDATAEKQASARQFAARLAREGATLEDSANALGTALKDAGLVKLVVQLVDNAVKGQKSRPVEIFSGEIPPAPAI